MCAVKTMALWEHEQEAATTFLDFEDEDEQLTWLGGI